MLVAVVVLAVVGMAGVLLARASAGRLAVARRPLERQPFLSGAPVSEHAVSRFHVRWYTVALVFLVFDMEMVFMYPWVLIVRDMGTEAVVEMFIFLGVLLAAVLYAWREGAFRWT